METHTRIDEYIAIEIMVSVSDHSLARSRERLKEVKEMPRVGGWKR